MSSNVAIRDEADVMFPEAPLLTCNLEVGEKLLMPKYPLFSILILFKVPPDVNMMELSGSNFMALRC